MAACRMACILDAGSRNEQNSDSSQVFPVSPTRGGHSGGNFAISLTRSGMLGTVEGTFPEALGFRSMLIE